MRVSLTRRFFNRLLLSGTVAACFHSYSTADTYLLYIGDEKDRQAAETMVKQALPDNAEPEVKVLSTDCKNAAEAQEHAKAIHAGVTQLPCLVVSDNQGPYALLNPIGLTKQQLEEAQAHAQHPDRMTLTAQRDLSARIYLLCAHLGTGEPNDQTLIKIVTECRDLLNHPQATEEQKQFIGYHCLYPALLLQYCKGYTGAHTPYTEAKLLEAIAALEAARDLNRETKIGKQAFSERERLRRARREARKYE